MPLNPLDIRKMTFRRRFRGYDEAEVEGFLALAAEELTNRLEEIDRLERESGEHRRRLRQAERRQEELQQALLHGQKLSQEITDQARREAELLLKEAGVTADSIINQAIEQANRVEGKIGELRTARRDLQLKLRNTLDLFQGLLKAEMEDEKSSATVRTLPRPRASSAPDGRS